ncbi:hypothetical protein V6N13_141379 [Hibiscus sabdariffa]|uniref:F-box domain-containing protein n=1 Tax=Hibiscus sabdariffa TaxID=183260 RepID=A0ABR2P4T7_9ROSI
MAKQVKFAGDFDRISSLSDQILCRILSFLPAKDAVRTSVLSPRWRYLLASMTVLIFNIAYLVSTPDSVLSREDEYLRLYGWISAALWRGVKEIDIRYTPLPLLPTFLFTSQSLVTLKLDIDDDMKVPCKICLPNLKTLHLKNLKFSDGESIYRLISSCLALEDLVMDLSELPKDMSELNIYSFSLKRLALNFVEMLTDSLIDFNYTIVINAPNLVYLKYDGPIAESYCLSTMNSLEKADVVVHQLDDEPSYDVNRESGATATISNLLCGICNVKSLSLTIVQPETLIRMPLEPVLQFHKLVELKLEILNEYRHWQGTWVIQLLCCAPNLETLHLGLPVPHRGFESLPEEVPPCLIFHLKEIKIKYFEGNEHMFEMIGYFLNHASVLEALMIGTEKDEELSIVRKLLRLPRNSKQCRVLLL